MNREESHEELIPKREYLYFLEKYHKNKLITTCQYKIFKKYYLSKEFIYPISSSNKMIRSYFDYMKKDKKLYLYVRMFVLLIHFMNSKKAKGMIDIIEKNPNIQDRNIIQLIEKMDKKNLFPNIYNNKKNSDLCHSKEYLYTLLYHKLIKILSDPKYALEEKYLELIKKKGRDFKYLDIGCGNGNKTKTIAHIFGIPDQNVYCADIPSWGPYNKERMAKFHKHHFQPINPQTGILNFPDNEFDFISVILTLHHIPNLSNSLREIKRILKPNGILMIIEHDALTKYDHLLIEIQHMLYGYLRDKSNPGWKNYIDNPITNRYMNIMEWTFVLNKFHLKYLYGNIIYEDVSHNLGFDNQFYGFFRNDKK